MALIKEQIVEAARELNRELGLEPRINTRQKVDSIKELLLEAASLITEEDDISEKTMGIIEELKMEMRQEYPDTSVLYNSDEDDDDGDEDEQIPEWEEDDEDDGDDEDDEDEPEEAPEDIAPAPEKKKTKPASKKQKPDRVTKKSIIEDSLKKGATISEMAERIVAAGVDADLEKNIRTVKLWLRKMGFDTKKAFIETNPIFKNSMKQKEN